MLYLQNKSIWKEKDLSRRKIGPGWGFLIESKREVRVVQLKFEGFGFGYG
jgi:hypothetical protein